MPSKPVLTHHASDFLTSWDDKDLLGEGAFAAVRKCNHTQLGTVVVKCFCIRGTPDQQKKATIRVEDEIKVLLQLEHCNIVQVIGNTKWKNCMGIIMEYVDGGSLDKFLFSEEVQDIPWPLRLRFLYEICYALAYLHHHDERKTFVHCDLKSENILLTKTLKIKIADFGSTNIAIKSGASTSLSVTKKNQHTVIYTAPEFLNDPTMEKKPSMDVYSVGMIGYEIVTRLQVFHDAQNLAVLISVIISRGQKPNEKHLQNVEKSLMTKPNDNDIYKFFMDIVRQCWNFQPNERPEMQKVYPLIKKKLSSLKCGSLDYNFGQFKSQSNTSKSNSSMKIKLNEFTFPFLEGPKPEQSSIKGTSHSKQPSIEKTEQLQQEIETLSLVPVNSNNVPMRKSQAENSRKEIVENYFVQQLRKMQSEVSKRDHKFKILDLWKHVKELNDDHVIQKAAEYFPRVLDMSWVWLNSNQVSLLCFMLKQSPTHIHKLDLSWCTLGAADFRNISLAIKARKAQVKTKRWAITP
ncbi:uncharacterized protein LOC143470096 isoform X1 [Clavelina lepadiformis]|uniref:uncharacterized protein LOC143470096 isoform X1 n=2 Tax=Clavelina lepadiformis TaxID=159417 RepID=UPI0040412DA1